MTTFTGSNPVLATKNKSMKDKKWKYYIPVYGIFVQPYMGKLLNDSEDDSFKLLMAFYHLMTTIPLITLMVFYLLSKLE
jgi:hypothetical protein